MSSAAGGDFSMSEHRTVGILYFLSGVLGIIGNAVLISIFRGDKALTGARSRLHVQFAVLNIMIVTGIPLSGASAFAGKWLFGSVGCQFYGCLTYTGGMGAVTFSGLLCIQRYLSTTSPSTYDKSSWPTFLSCIGWIYSLSVSIGPLVGWNSYVIESSGTACGLNWHQNDWSHRSLFIALPVVTLFQLVLASLSLRGAFTAQVPVKTDDKDWFTNNQLNWIALSNLLIMFIGFAPYGFFSVWALFNHDTQMTMLASVIPPLFAKYSTCFYPIVYMVASKKFQEAFSSRLFGACIDKKDQ